MHLCDTCRKFNKCYPNNTWPTEEKREEVASKGCKNYKELSVESMFKPRRKEAK